jgi:CheY-like chemotaxis protein
VVVAELVAVRPSVFVIEDDPDSLRLRRETLQDEGCAVFGFNNAIEAIAALEQSEEVDLVLTDINLVRRRFDKSGVKIAQWVKTHLPDVPVAAYSGFLGQDDLREDERALFTKCFMKGGLTADDIEDAVREVVKIAHERLESRTGSGPSNGGERKEDIMLHDLNDAHHVLRQPIPLSVTRHGQGVSVWSQDLEEVGFGTSETDAVEDIQKTIVELYDSLQTDEHVLGPAMQDLWHRLQRIVEFRT